jgi:hypothetical protein
VFQKRRVRSEYEDHGLKVESNPATVTYRGIEAPRRSIGNPSITSRNQQRLGGASDEQSESQVLTGIGEAFPFRNSFAYNSVQTWHPGLCGGLD